ncbi:hypothetical protein F5882DRAFT_462523 [Hyaloscypha sp. PMI_1271]|nr:hypothetical protein F5882DRAFT_462523 [Hyaloscypha sp. PMI_1271]
MSLSTLHSSPAPHTPRACSSGTQFLPCPIAEEPTNNWSAEDEAAWDQRLATGGSKKILTARKRMDIRWWLQNPNTSLPGGTKDNQVYRKEYHDTRRDEIVPARYALCYNDAFEILTTIHEKLMHASPSTAFEHHDPDGEYQWIWQLKCHFSKFVWIRGLKAKTADEAANELSKWLNENGYISILACDNGGEFKGEVIEVCSIEVANRIFKKRLRAARADTGIQSWIQLLPLIA